MLAYWSAFRNAQSQVSSLTLSSPSDAARFPILGGGEQAGSISAGSRVEHYEMAGYLTAIALAKKLNAAEVVDLLKQSLAEEEAAEQKLRRTAVTLIKLAPAG